MQREMILMHDGQHFKALKLTAVTKQRCSAELCLKSTYQTTMIENIKGTLLSFTYNYNSSRKCRFALSNICVLIFAILLPSDRWTDSALWLKIASTSVRSYGQKKLERPLVDLGGYCFDHVVSV